MVRLHAFLALLAGFAAMVAIGLTVTALLRRFAPQWAEPGRKLSPASVSMNLGLAFFSAAAGGFVTAWTAGDNALRAVLALAIVVLALGAISTLQARKKQPVWYQMVLLILSPLGAVAGGLLRLRVVGIL
jgi:hypothetical protein